MFRASRGATSSGALVHLDSLSLYGTGAMSPLIEVAHLFRERTETKALNSAITSTRSGGQAQPGLGSLQHPRTGESSHSGAWEGGLATAKRRCGERKFVLLRSSKSLDGHRTPKAAAVAINDSS